MNDQNFEATKGASREANRGDKKAAKGRQAVTTGGVITGARSKANREAERSANREANK